MKRGLITTVLTLLVVLGATVGYFVGISNSRTLTTTHTQVLGREVSLVEVNGSYYWADDVSKDMVIGFPGYSYFLNGSVTFDGVKFTTNCPPVYAGCPVPAGTTTQTQETVLASAISFTMTFPDNVTETAGEVIGTTIYSYVISSHTPRAGMLIEYVNDYPNNSVDYAVFLLVSSCNAPPHLC